MTIEECIEFMPTMFGRPFYQVGCPIKDYSINDVHIVDIYFRHSGVDPEKYGDKDPDDEVILIAYTLYYINAPIFDSGDPEYMAELRSKATAVANFDELWHLCGEYGIDPF